jgi:hypothetical protein
MCVKLIDVLSAHGSQLAFDPDVVTYLCNVVLPRQMMESTVNRGKTLEENKLVQYDEMPPLEDSQDLENQMNFLLNKQSPLEEDPFEARPPPPAPKNRHVLKFDFDGSTKVFMNTQKLPKNSLMTGFKSKRGLALDIEEEKSEPPKMTSAMVGELMKTKAEDPNNFANENVMAKSNLRQPKSFNFGFSDSDGEDEGAPLPPPKAKRGMAPLMSSRHGRPSFLEEEVPAKRPNLMIGGTTGATSDETASMEPPPVSRGGKKQQAVISYQKKAKLFTNANLKLNIDTDAINELFTFGGEKG